MLSYLLLFCVLTFSGLLMLESAVLAPAIMVWWLSLPWLLSALAPVSHTLLQHTFERSRASLAVQTHLSWHIETKLVAAPAQPTQQQAMQFWHVDAGNPVVATMGLPFTWTLLLASPYGAIGKTLLGTIIALAACIAMLWLKLVVAMTQLLAGTTAFQVYVMRDVYLTHAPLPTWLPAVLEVAELFSLYLVVLIGPVLLAWWLNRAIWQTPTTTSCQYG